MVIAKLVDYECNPIPNEPVVVLRDLGTLPTGGSVSKADKTTTDEEGFFKFKANARSYMIKKDTQDLQYYRKFRSDRWGYAVGSDITIDIKNELQRSSYQSPFYVYIDKHLPAGIKHGYDSDLIRIEFSENTAQMLPTSFGSTPGSIVHLSWKMENAKPFIWVTGIENGGVIDITENTELLKRIPISNYSKTLKYEIKDKTFRKLFLVRGDASQFYSIFSMDLVYDETLEVAYLSILLNTIAVDKYSQNGRVRAITKPIIPQENCGGVFSRSHNGYFSLLDDEELTYLKATARALPFKSEISNSEKLTIAAHPKTPLDWYKKNIDNQLIAETALDNNGDIKDRIEFIYNKSKDSNWNSVIKVISKDVRTPESILLDIVNNHDIPINYVAYNPSSTIKVQNRILEKLNNTLNSSNSMNRLAVIQNIIETLARKDNITPELLEKSHKILEKSISMHRAKDDVISSTEIRLIKNKQATSIMLDRTYEKVNENKLIDAYSSQSRSAWKVIAQHDNASSNSLEFIIRLLLNDKFNSSTYNILLAAIANKNLSMNFKRELYKVDNKYLNLIFAELEDTPKDHLIKLSERNDRRINVNLAKNAATPDSVFRKIAFRKAESKFDYRIAKMEIAKNPAAPIDVLHELSKDSGLLSNMMYNPSIDETIISKLKRKPYYAFKIASTNEKVLRSLNKIESSGKVTRLSGYYSLETILKIKELPGDTIRRIYKYRHKPVTHLIAHHKNTPVDILEEIFHETGSFAVIKALASNPKTPAEILESIFEGNYRITSKIFSDYEIENHLYCNTNLPNNLRDRLHYSLHIDCEQLEKRFIR
jgi:hypothetical protein